MKPVAPGVVRPEFENGLPEGLVGRRVRAVKRRYLRKRAMHVETPYIGEVSAVYRGMDGTILFVVILTGASANRTRRWIGRVGLISIETLDDEPAKVIG